jgi:hypothetical protein
VGSTSVRPVGVLAHPLEHVIVGISAVGLGCTQDSGLLVNVLNVTLESQQSALAIFQLFDFRICNLEQLVSTAKNISAFRVL